MVPTPAVRAEGEIKYDEAKRRAALWQGLAKALPKEYTEIGVYAENVGLSEILFRSNRTTLRFSLKSGKVEVVDHMKILGKINRITYGKGTGGGYYALWSSGKRELTVSAEP